MGKLDVIVIGGLAALVAVGIFTVTNPSIRKVAEDYVGGTLQETIGGMFRGAPTYGQSGTSTAEDFNGNGVPETYMTLSGGTKCFLTFDGKPAAEYAGRFGGTTVTGPGGQFCYTRIGGRTAEAFASERR